MFGKNPNTWPGKRLTLYPTTCRFGPKMVHCIRVYGSPDVAEDKSVSERIGRSTLKATLHAVKGGGRAASVTNGEQAANKSSNHVGKQEVERDSPILEAWAALGWTRDEGEKDLASYTGKDYLSHLGALIDQMNAQEAS
jgi:hypothetical protein